MKNQWSNYVNVSANVHILFFATTKNREISCYITHQLCETILKLEMFFYYQEVLDFSTISKVKFVISKEIHNTHNKTTFDQ